MPVFGFGDRIGSRGLAASGILPELADDAGSVFVFAATMAEGVEDAVHVTRRVRQLRVR